MTILIIEQEQQLANQLKNHIISVKEECSFLPVADTMRGSLGSVSTATPDVIFINIELSDPEVFDDFRKLKLSCAVVFTITNEAAIAKNIQHDGFTYLLKPVQELMIKQLFRDIERNRERDYFRPTLSYEPGIPERPLTEKSYKSGFLVKQSQRLIPVRTTEINHFSTEGSLVCLVTTDKRKYVIDETLNELEQLLNPADFFRVNRKFILAKDTIRSLDYYSKGQVIVKANLLEGERITVSRQQTPSLKSWLSQ